MLVLPGRVVHESHHGYGTITMQEVLEKSSNIGAIMIGTRVGRENMYEYARRFGFGQKTGLPLPAESRRKLRTLNHWGTTSLASISMGQEVSVTSVQLARLGAVIANGGMLVKPRLILKRGDKPEPVEAAGTRAQAGNRDHDAPHDGRRGAARHGPRACAARWLYFGRENRHRADLRFRDAPLHAQLQRVVPGFRAGDQSGARGAGDGAQHVRRKRPGRRCGGAGIPEDHDGGAADAGRAERYSGRHDGSTKKPAKEKPGEFDGDLAIADLGEPSIMDDDPTVRQLLADQMKPAKDPDEIPPANATDTPPATVNCCGAGDLVAGVPAVKPAGDKIAAPPCRISAVNRCGMWWRNPRRAALK